MKLRQILVLFTLSLGAHQPVFVMQPPQNGMLHTVWGMVGDAARFAERQVDKGVDYVKERIAAKDREIARLDADAANEQLSEDVRANARATATKLRAERGAAENLVMDAAHLAIQQQLQEKPIDKTKVATEAAAARATAAEKGKADIANHTATLNFIREFAQNPAMLAGITLAVVGVGVACYYGGTLGYQYLKTKMGTPEIVRETSRISAAQQTVAKLRNLIGKQQPAKLFRSNVITAPHIDQQLKEIAEEVKAAQQTGDDLYNVMFYGPPGVGKTMFAKELARYSGLDYAVLSGADFTQLPVGKAITKLHELIDWAEHNERGTILFIDECEAFLRNRALGNATEASRKLTQAFLSRVEKPSAKKLMIVFATNCPEQLDPAALSRISKRIEFTLPSNAEAAKILDLYLSKATADGKTIVGKDLDATQLVKNMTDAHFGGREIEDAAKQMARRARLANKGVISKAIAETIVSRQADEMKKQTSARGSLLLKQSTEATSSEPTAIAA